jgi:hypothetical protein
MIEMAGRDACAARKSGIDALLVLGTIISMTRQLSIFSCVSPL